MVLGEEDLAKESAIIAGTQTSEEGFQPVVAGLSEGHKRLARSKGQFYFIF